MIDLLAYAALSKPVIVTVHVLGVAFAVWVVRRRFAGVGAP